MPRTLDQLVEVGASFAQTYAPVLEFAGWKVAMLRAFDATAPATFYRVERHWNTNEVFILTAGAADLIILDGLDDSSDPGQPVFYVEPMRPHVAYNVGQSVWHHVVMTPDAHIVLFERAETGPATTDYAELEPALIAAIRGSFRIPAA